MNDNYIFTTIHGSNLYGFSHVGSDRDIFVVTTDTARKSKHKTIGDLDVVEIGLDSFLEKAYSGSHQSVEALYSQEKVWYNSRYRDLLEGITVTGPEVHAKYRRTIRKFCFGDFKRRRHACRLFINLQELIKYGKIEPRLSEAHVKMCNDYAQSYEGDELWDSLTGLENVSLPGPTDRYA